MSASSLPSSVSQLLQAALALLTEPSIVVEASKAVVPVMPISVWTRWIASIILSKGTSLTVSAVTFIESPSTPVSLMRRAISACVPP